jgi:hypothetical protein
MPAVSFGLKSVGERGRTPREVGLLYRVSADTVRAWIQAGQLGALNLARTRCGKPRYVILPQHLADFEQARRVSPPPEPTPRRKQPSGFIDYYPD